MQRTDFFRSKAKRERISCCRLSFLLCVKIINYDVFLFFPAYDKVSVSVGIVNL